MKKDENKEIQFAVLATDIAVFTVKDQELLVRFIKVDRPPYFQNIAGLPGGLLKPQETAEEAVLRLVKEKALIDPKKLYIEQLYTFSEVNRDPRGRIVSVVYIALIPWEDLTLEEKKEGEDIWWNKAVTKEKLAYDHNKVLNMAVSRLRSRITYTTLISKIIPEQFTLTELENIFESVLGKDIDKRNFRKKINKLNIIKPLNLKRVGQKHRPASLYKFNSKDIREIDFL